MKSRWLKGVIAAVAVSALSIGVWIWLLPEARQNERVQNPPAKPPNCHSGSDLEILKLADGRLADVRILQIRDTKFYVPADWLAQDFVDSQAVKFGPTFAYQSLEKFSPDIHEKECPGIVHTLNLHGTTPRFGTNRGTYLFFGLDGKFAPREVLGSGGRLQGFSVMVQAATTTSGIEMDSPRLSSVGNYWIKGNRDFFLLVGGPTNDELHEEYGIELRKLAIWLMEPPATRTNDRVFFASPNFP